MERQQAYKDSKDGFIEIFHV